MKEQRQLTRRQFLNQTTVYAVGRVLGVDKLRSPERLIPSRVLGFYLPFHEIVKDATMNTFKKLVLAAGANTVVVDIKNEYGYVNIPFEHPLLKSKMQSWAIDYKKTDELLAWADKNRILIVGRQVVMEDAVLVNANPQLAVRDNKGLIWRGGGRIWANPFDERVAEYNAAIAEQAAKYGIKVILYDYVRLPADGQIKTIKYSQANTRENRVAAINAFFEQAKPRVNQYGSLLGASLFGYTAFAQFKDMGVGKDLESAALRLDWFCHMAYPGLYDSGLADEESCGKDKCLPPTAHNYEIVNATVREALARTRAVNPNAVAVPWIQAYPDGRYGRRMGLEQFEDQQRGAFDAGARGVLAWNPSLKYHPEFYQTVGGEE